MKALLSALQGVKWTMANLLDDAGLRLPECLRLRMKDSHALLLRVSLRTTTLPISGLYHAAYHLLPPRFRTSIAG